MTLCARAPAKVEPRAVALEESERELGIAREIRCALDDALGSDGWRRVAEDSEETAEPTSDEPPSALEVEFRLVSAEAPADAILELTASSKPQAFVFVCSQVSGDNHEATKMRRQLFLEAPCEVLWLRPGSAKPGTNGRIVTTAARGPHGKQSLTLAHALGELSEDSEVTALYVERNVGALSTAVGERVLEGHVSRALGARASTVKRAVVVNDRVHDGIHGYVERTGPELLILGASKRSALGRRFMRTPGLKVLQAAPEQTALLVRAPLRLHGRLWRRAEVLLQNTVPQLEREQRVALVERVQSNSHWNFDFVALMSLSTLIAGLGLMTNSAAVIIGAMLVAPLMTPLLGIGLALVQGNPNLVRASLRTVSLGFATAYILGLVLGALDPTFNVATPEMVARGSPGLRDLLVAFVSGLAGAYASSRSGLLAALPGVAIAAALVPPIATSGLATALWLSGADVSAGLIGGALLLFFTNAVLIIFAATLSLASVGVRFEPGSSRTSQAVGAALIVLALSLTVVLWFMGPGAVPRSGIERALPPGFRLQHAQWVKDPRGAPAILEVRVTGPGRALEGFVDGLLALPKVEKVRVETIREYYSTD